MLSLQEKVRKITQRLNLVNTPELSCLDLTSEVGEIAKEVLELTDYGRRKHIFNPDLKRELGDCFYSLVNLANIYNIDLEKELNNSLQKYIKREAQRNPNQRKIKLEPIVLAKNFLCLNAIAGCRNNCIYCYKHGWDIKNKFIPQKFCKVKEILQSIKSHRYFHPNIPLAIHNSATDPFQDDVVETTFRILDGLEKMDISNIVGLITKEYLSKKIIERIESYKKIRPIMFVTYSCLPEKYEKIINERRLKTMKNLSSSKLKRVLYYRPIIKGVNDKEKIVERIIKLGKNYFDCIVRSSIKLDINTIEYMAKRGIYLDPSYDIGLNIHDSIKEMLPETRERVDPILAKANIPYFKKTSCAISYLFDEPDYNTQWVRPEYYCSFSCPTRQKKKCSIAARRRPRSKNVDKLIRHLGLRVKYKIDNDAVEIQSDKIYYSDIKFLRMALRFPVLVNVKGERLTAEEYDRKYVNVDRGEIRKQIKKMGIKGYSLREKFY